MIVFVTEIILNGVLTKTSLLYTTVHHYCGGRMAE